MLFRSCTQTPIPALTSNEGQVYPDTCVANPKTAAGQGLPGMTFLVVLTSQDPCPTDLSTNTNNSNSVLYPSNVQLQNVKLRFNQVIMPDEVKSQILGWMYSEDGFKVVYPSWWLEKQSINTLNFQCTNPAVAKASIYGFSTYVTCPAMPNQTGNWNHTTICPFSSIKTVVQNDTKTYYTQDFCTNQTGGIFPYRQPILNGTQIGRAHV